MRPIGNAPLGVVFGLSALAGAAILAAGSCGLEAPAIGTPCVDSTGCPSGYACDPGISRCLPGDAGPIDAGPRDAGPGDAGPGDAGPGDAGPIDAGPRDAGTADAGSADAGTIVCEVYVGTDRPPVAFGTTVVVTASAVATVQLAATDPDSVTLAYQLVSEEGVAVDVTAAGSATVTASSDGSFRFRATDEGGACSEERVDVVVVDPADFGFRFIGAVDANWSAPGSWEPIGPPGEGASVFVPRNALVDVDVDVSSPLGALVVASGASLALGLRTITAADVLVGGSITGNAPIQLWASGGELGGALPDVGVLGASTVTRPVTVAGDLAVSGGALTVLAPLAVDGNLSTTSSGALIQPDDVRIHVEAAASFDGQRSALSAGTVSVRGPFQHFASTAYGAFLGLGAHTLVLDGAARQRVNLQGHVAGLRANHVEIRGPVELETNFGCDGNLRVRNGGSLDSPLYVDMPGQLFVDLGGTFAPAAYWLRNDFDVDGSYQVDSTTLMLPLDLPAGLTLRDVVIGSAINVVDDETVRDLLVIGGYPLVVQDATLTTRDLTVADYATLGTAYGTSRVVVDGNAWFRPIGPEASLAAGSISFRGAAVSLFNNTSLFTRGFGGVGHAWLFEASGTTVLTSDITAQGCSGDRSVACTIDDTCTTAGIGTCVTGGVYLHNVVVAPGTTLEVGNGVTVGRGVVVLSDLTVPAGAALILHEPLELGGAYDVAPGSVTCDSQALSPLICP